MQQRKIKLNQIKDVKDFVDAATKCDFEIDIFYNRVTIDAKSILGILSMDLTHDLTVQYFGENSGFETVLNKYAVA